MLLLLIIATIGKQKIIVNIVDYKKAKLTPESMEFHSGSNHLLV